MTDTTRLRRAIEPILERCLDFFGVDDLDPESSEAMPVVIKNRWVYELRAALSEEAVPVETTARLRALEIIEGGAISRDAVAHAPIESRWVDIERVRAALSEEAPAPLDVEAALMCGACFHPLHRGEPCGLSVRTRESVEGFCYCGISAALAPSSAEGEDER